jgi:hypothetical protein
MSTLTVSTRTYDRVTDLASAWGISADAAIVRLIDFWKDVSTNSQDGASTGSHDEADQVRIHVRYYGKRAEGIYHPSTGLVDITSGPAAGATELKPSPAAGEVIRTVQQARGKKVTGSRNGWSFWIVTATGELLQSIRP